MVNNHNPEIPEMKRTGTGNRKSRVVHRNFLLPLGMLKKPETAPFPRYVIPARRRGTVSDDSDVGFDDDSIQAVRPRRIRQKPSWQSSGDLLM